SGGTGEEHRAIVAKSEDPYGPYKLYQSPILTHNQLPEHPIQNIGHADFVEDHKGNWWAVFLGTRPVDGDYTILGRETFLASIRWTKEGWPLIDNNEGTVNNIMETNMSLGESNFKARSINREDFNDENLDKSWMYLRQKNQVNYSLVER